MIEDSHKGALDTLLKISVLHPFTNIAPSQTDLLEFFKLNFVKFLSKITSLRLLSLAMSVIVALIPRISSAS